MVIVALLTGFLPTEDWQSLKWRKLSLKQGNINFLTEFASITANSLTFTGRTTSYVYDIRYNTKNTLLYLHFLRWEFFSNRLYCPLVAFLFNVIRKQKLFCITQYKFIFLLTDVWLKKKKNTFLPFNLRHRLNKVFYIPINWISLESSCRFYTFRSPKESLVI